MVSASQLEPRALPEFPLTRQPRVEKSTGASTRGPRIILCAIALLSLLGIAFAFWLRTVPAGTPDPRAWFNVFYVLFSRNEAAGLGVVALFSIASVCFIFQRRTKSIVEQTTSWICGREKWCLIFIALAVFVIARAGIELVSHNYALTADEYMADFQARIFLHGKIRAEVPEQWVPAVRAIKPTYADYFPATHSWKSAYLPVYAAMRAVFQSVGLQSLLNPLLAALSIIFLYATARNLWPENKNNALVAGALMASSSQFLLMAMTSYAMPAHLALNTLWLWLYSRPDRRRFYIAPFVGVLAMGLHQPIVHALFVAPFLLRLLLQKRWRAVSVFGIVYLAGCLGWAAWRNYYTVPSSVGLTPFFRLLNPRMAIIQPMNVCLLIGWSCLATPLLTVLGARRFLHLPTILQDAAISCLVTFGFYFFFYLDQAHGWGYRYFHGTLGCLVLIAVAGWQFLTESVGAYRARAFLLSGLIASAFLQLPMRCFQAETFVRPFARTAAALHSIPTQIVGMDARDAWYSADLIRNDPFLRDRPIIVALHVLTPEAIAVLEKGGSVRFIDRAALSRLGMSTERSGILKRDPFELGRGR